MLRKSLRYTSRALLSAAIGWSLIPIAAADAPSTPPADPAKHLFTIPDDGMGDDEWLSGANNIVRAILAKHPKEDVVICVAGCVVQERVVYAQPAQEPMPKAEVMSAAPPSAPLAEKDAAKTSEPETKGEAPVDQSSEAKAKRADANAALKASEGAGNGHSGSNSAFVPTSSGAGSMSDAPTEPMSQPSEDMSEPSLGGEVN